MMAAISFRVYSTGRLPPIIIACCIWRFLHGLSFLRGDVADTPNWEIDVALPYAQGIWKQGMRVRHGIRAPPLAEALG